MKRIVLFCIALACFGVVARSQGSSHSAVTGSFPALGNQQIKLVGFDGFSTYTIDRVRADKQGRFSLSFGEEDHGMGYLVAEDEQAFIVFLASGENLGLKGENLAFVETVEIDSGRHYTTSSASELDKSKSVIITETSSVLSILNATHR